MSKTASIVVYVVIFVLALLLCVGACLPDGIEVGEYWYYHAPINYIQGDKLFADVQEVTYKVKFDDDVEDTDKELENVASAIRSRLANMYGYWFCDVTCDKENNCITVDVPVTANENNTSATSILSSVTQTGKMEFVTSSTYDADDVIEGLTTDHFKKMTIRRYSNSSASYYILDVTLDSEGKTIASKNLTESSSSFSAYFAVDGSVVAGVAYSSSNDDLMIYTYYESTCNSLKGLIESGTLKAELTDETKGTEDIIKENHVRLIYGILVAAVILGSWIFYYVRYGKVSLGVILSQLIAVTAFVWFAGGVYFNLLNVASAIGILGGYVLMSYFSCTVMEKIKAYGSEKKFATARYKAFHENIKWTCIVHAIVLVAGVILWVIPTGVTAPLGNALVYSAVLSFIATMGMNRLFTSLVAPLC